MGLRVSVGGNVLALVNFVLYLGVLTNPLLSWTLHVHAITSRARDVFQLFDMSHTACSAVCAII